MSSSEEKEPVKEEEQTTSTSSTTTTTTTTNNNGGGDNDDYDGMTYEQRLSWLRERGVQVEMPGEGSSNSNSSSDKKNNDDNDVIKEVINYVLIPHDTSKPLQEFSFTQPYNNYTDDDDDAKKNSSPSLPIISTNQGGDQLIEHLKPKFSTSSSSKDDEIDISLLQQRMSTTTLSSDTNKQVSEETLQKVAKEGHVEVFNLVHAIKDNKYIGINIYLDEAGMLKRLPINKRACIYAEKCGYNPSPQFYGDVYLGKIQIKPKIKNLSFKLGVDTSLENPLPQWLQNATQNNLQYQYEFNHLTGRTGINEEQQPKVDGDDGIPKEEEQGAYSWIQTDDEIEITIPLPSSSTSTSNDSNTNNNNSNDSSNSNSNVNNNNIIHTKNIHVRFLPKSIEFSIHEKILYNIHLYDKVDIDGCTWTTETQIGTAGKNNNQQVVIITCEKVNIGLWPRITY